LHSTLRLKIIGAVAFIIVALIFYIFQSISENQIGIFSNWVVPDGMGLHAAVKLLISGHISIDDLQSGWGAYAFYYPSKWVGVVGYFFMNLVCLLVIGWRLGFGCIILMPYFIVAIALPSKDILILLATLFFISGFKFEAQRA